MLGRGGAAFGLAVVLLVTGCSDDDDGAAPDSTTSTTAGSSSETTIARNGDPEYCAALVDFQERVTTVSAPPPGASPQEVEDLWNSLAEAEGRLIQNAPDGMEGVTQQVVTAFDQFRIDADALGFDYDSFADLASSSSIDPGSAIAAAAANLFTYGDERCPAADAAER